MKKIFLIALAALLFSQLSFAQKLKEADLEKERQLFLDSIATSYHYQTGQVNLPGGMAILTVPQGWRYLDGPQSDQVLTGLWGNPPGQNSLGMLFPENLGPLDTASIAFNITWEEMGFVKDGDADDIDYNDLLKETQKGTEEENKERQKEGYPPITIVGWASQPFYDKEKKVLHWAKEIQFGDVAENTLNYDVRVLGRKGVLSMNAIGTVSQLPQVKAAIPEIVTAAAFTQGNRYSDFSETSGDKIAAWTIGGLVAGKVLAKVGFFAVIAKFGKVILVALLAAGAAIKRFFTGERKESEESNFTTNVKDPEDEAPV